MTFTIEITADDAPSVFRFEPSSVSEYDIAYRVFPERPPESVEFRMTKGTDGQWRISKPDIPGWIGMHELELAKAIEEREYPQDI